MKLNSRLSVLYYLWVASTALLLLIKGFIPNQELPISLVFLIPTFTLFLYLYKRKAFFRKNAPAEIFNGLMWIFSLTLGADVALQLIELFLNGGRIPNKGVIGFILAVVYVVIVKVLIKPGSIRK